jgi:hypothetical protein
MIVAALVLTAETVVVLAVGFSWFRAQGYGFAEAGTAAILSLFMAFSMIHQIACLAGAPLIGILLEVGFPAALIFLFLRRPLRAHLVAAYEAGVGLLRRETFSVGILAATYGIMVVLVLLGWLGPGGGSPFAVAGSAAVPVGGLLPSTGAASLTPLNGAALFYHSGRFGLSPGACGFGLLAHLAVGLSTYALARRYAWPPMALTVTLVVVSMPRLVFLGIRPTAESIATAALLGALVLLYRLVEQHRAGDLALFLLCMAFSIHTHPMSLGLALLMVLLLLVVMVRRHGWILWKEILTGKALAAVPLLLAVLILAQVPVFALNLVHGEPLFGTRQAFGGDGLMGAAVNLLRYLLLSIDPTEAVRRGILWLTGLDLARLVAGIDALVVAPLAAYTGATPVFTPLFSGGGGVGFGPLVPLLVLPSMAHAFWRGPRRLKALMVAWAGYLYLAALVLAWQPDGLSVLTPLFAANGFVVAFALPPYRLRRRGMRLLHWLCVPLLILAFRLALSGV